MGESTTEGADKVHFELVTPAKILVAEDADMVVVPGGAGDFGVLPGHAPLLSSLRPGVVHLHDGDAIVERIFVSGGFAEVTAERCTVLAEEAVRVAEIAPDEAEKRLEAARQRLAEADDEKDREQAEHDVNSAEIMVAAATATAHGGG
jgi:F-type H+-transporting ATPase subunit epsilon